MLDYDMCVNVFEVSKGRVAQDDRECGEYRMLADSLTAWLQKRATKIKDYVEKHKS
jgi:hypothetical protein